ncbi:MAG: D-aminoacyl-tRNA deacylase [Candidatus Thermoplasmatota archaeon]|nr:D-aminoacyl-tRNA deacylase [Candidatus Thermoplasmatota archaeon]
MILIVISDKDEAGTNIRDHIMKMMEWDDLGNKIWRHEDIIMTSIDDYHLYHDNIDSETGRNINIKCDGKVHATEFAKQIPSILGKNQRFFPSESTFPSILGKTEGFSVRFDVVIFASKHKSESGMKTLSVHPIGNYDKADFGGREKTLVNTSPHLMTTALRTMKEKNKTDYHVCFEVTHHGPYLSTPAFFIEIGSDEKSWNDKNAGKTVAETIIETIKKPEKYPVLIGVGGGHYAPRFTDMALKKKVSFAHMLPKYQIENIDEKMVEEVIEKSKPDFVYFHKKGMRKSDYRRLKEVFENKGIKDVKEEELEDLEK